MPKETKRQRLDRLEKELKDDFTSKGWEAHYTDLDNYIHPGSVRLATQTISERNRGSKNRGKIINSSGSMALRTAVSGLMGGITSPARPWKRLTTPDPGLAEFGPVKQWLFTVNKRMDDVFARSNFYYLLPQIYRQLLAFGTSCSMIVKDPIDTIIGHGFPIGSFYLATNNRSKVDTIVRRFAKTVRQVVMDFGQYDIRTGAAKWDNISTTVKNHWDRSDYETLVEVTHVVMPNIDFDRTQSQSKFKRVMSAYYETGRNQGKGSNEVFLRESGFDRFPGLAPRWDLASPDDVLGKSCPGMEALGDVKALQLLEKRKAQAIEKGYNPPLIAPASLRNEKVSSLPSDITYHDIREGFQGLKPIYEIKPDIQGLLLDIEAHQFRISRVFFEDLFLMLTNLDRKQITAFEVAERHEEKLLMLGPVLERVDNELLKPAIDLTFDGMLLDGLIPEPPQEIQDIELKVEYISILAQAQKLVSTSGMDRFFSVIGGLREQNPEVVDKVDYDQGVDEYADMMGIPPTIVVDDATVKRKREIRNKLLAAQAAQQQQAAQAQTAKVQSETDTSGDNALTNAGGA